MISAKEARKATEAARRRIASEVDEVVIRHAKRISEQVMACASAGGCSIEYRVEQIRGGARAAEVAAALKTRLEASGFTMILNDLAGRDAPYRDIRISW